MPTNIQIKRHTSNTEWHWYTVCTVWDNENLGFIERLLQANGFETNTVKV